jgi:2-desacetyl-2-hydroxyethyl bacteriochlorophyllide A dehydrogenase
VETHNVQSIDALVCLEPGKLQIEKRPSPPSDPGQVLVRPRCVGICGTDYHIFEGKHPFLNYPRVMGHELAVEAVEAPPGTGIERGEILAVNPYLSCGQCIACRKGKPNCCVQISVLGVHQDGGLAGLLNIPASNLIHAPGLTPDQCSVVEFLAIGAHAVRRGAVTGNDRVLVVGAGPIGLGVALFASLSGGKVWVLDLDQGRASTAKLLLGVAAISRDDDMATSVEASTDAEGFDVVFDATGKTDAMEKGFDYVAHGGRYVLVSVVKDPITFADPDFHRKEMTLLGSRNATSEDFQRVITAIRDGMVPVDRMITHRTSLAGAVANIPRWATDKSGLIKAVVEFH